jgi:Spy/CpxP family protein refolding chaperone
MKTRYPLLLCLCAVLIASPSIARADDETPPSQGQNTPASELTPAQKYERMQRMKAIFAQLNLTDDQKQQIREIRQTVTDPAQRHQEVMAVLTPDQKEKLKELFQQNRNNNGGGGAGGETGGGNGSGATGTTASNSPGGAGDGSDLAPGAN